MIRVVLDTNILISALLQPQGLPARTFVMVLAGTTAQLCVSGDVYAESLVSGEKLGPHRQSIVHEELTAIGFGNDLNLIGWKMTILEAFRRGATMGHEPWPNCLFPIDRASASQRVSKVRSSLPWRSLLEKLFLLGSVSRHEFRTIDLQGESPRYRSLPTLHAEQAVSHGLPR